MALTINHNMKFRVVTMTPEWAAELLKQNHPNNRKPKDGRISSYAREMASGLWKLTHQGVAVDEDGRLIDGQNRLNAVVLANVEVPMVLITGVPRRAMVAADCGANRNVLDAARIGGKPLPKTAYAAVARAMLLGMNNTWGGGRQLGNQEILNFIAHHKEALEFSFDCLKQNITGLTQGPVRAVVARAYYRRNSRMRVRQFCEYLYSGLIGNSEKDVAAIRLRNWLLQAKSRNYKCTPKDVYGKTERALDAFLNEEQLETLYTTKEELFPIPDAGLLEDVVAPDPSANGVAELEKVVS